MSFTELLIKAGGFKPVIFISILFAVSVFSCFALSSLIKNYMLKKTMDNIISTGEVKLVATGFEKFLFKKLKINIKSKSAIISFRIMMIFGVLVLSKILSFSISMYIFAEVFIIYFFDSKFARELDKIGVTSLFNVNEFLDSFVPSISAGQSVDQSMLAFIQKKQDERLLTWWYDKNSEPAPEWKDAIKIYNNAKYNEINGAEDNTASTQDDILMKLSFYNDFEKGVGEAKSIEACFTYFVPIIILISFTNNRDFWLGFGGFTISIFVMIMYFAYQFLIYNVKVKVLNDLF